MALSHRRAGARSSTPAVPAGNADRRRQRDVHQHAARKGDGSRTCDGPRNLALRRESQPERRIRRFREPRRRNLGRRDVEAGRAMPPSHLPRHGRCTAHFARRRVRPSVCDVRHRGHDRASRRTSYSSRVSCRISGDKSAGRRQRPRDNGLVHRRQLAACTGERRSARVRCADRRIALDLAPYPTGSEGSGVRLVARTAAPHERALRMSGRSWQPTPGAI